MPNKYKVIVTPQAQQQLSNIKDYILLELKSPIAANNTLLALKTAIESLEQMPKRFPFTDEEKWRKHSVHKMSVKNFLIYFIVDDVDFEVYVFAVLYARRDQKKALKKTQE